MKAGEAAASQQTGHSGPVIFVFGMLCLPDSGEERFMRLKSDFITQEIDDTQFLIPVGGESFNGVARGNKTAAFIVNCLKEETTEEAIVDALCAEYDAPREIIASDVAGVLNILREINALEE